MALDSNTGLGHDADQRVGASDPFCHRRWMGVLVACRSRDPQVAGSFGQYQPGRDDQVFGYLTQCLQVVLQGLVDQIRLFYAAALHVGIDRGLGLFRDVGGNLGGCRHGPGFSRNP